MIFFIISEIRGVNKNNAHKKPTKALAHRRDIIYGCESKPDP